MAPLLVLLRGDHYGLDGAGAGLAVDVDVVSPVGIGAVPRDLVDDVGRDTADRGPAALHGPLRGEGLAGPGHTGSDVPDDEGFAGVRGDA